MPRNASRKRKKSKNRPNNKNNATSIGQGTSSAPSCGLTSPTTTTLTTSLTSEPVEVPDSSAVAVKNLLLQDLAKLVQQKCVLEVAILYLLIQNEIVMANSWRFGDLGKSLFNFLVGGSNTNLNQTSSSTSSSSTRPPRCQEIPEYFQPRSNEVGPTPQTVPRKKKGGGGKNGNNSKSSSETSSLTSLSNVAPQPETSLTKPTTTKKSTLAMPKLKQSEAVTAITQDITTVTPSSKKPAKVNHQQTNSTAKASKQTHSSDSTGNKAKDVTLVTEGVVTKIPRAAKLNDAITLVSKELPHNSVIVTEAVPLIFAPENVVKPPIEAVRSKSSSSVTVVQPSCSLVDSKEEIVFLRRQLEQNVGFARNFFSCFVQTIMWAKTGVLRFLVFLQAI